MRNNPKSLEEEYYLSTQGESDEMIGSLGLNKPSEDASYILDIDKLVFPKIDSGKRNYSADPETDWIIDLTSIDGDNFYTTDLHKLFNADWNSNFPSNTYGFIPEKNEWTFVFAGGVPDNFSKIQIGINLKRVFIEENEDYNPQKLNRYLIQLENSLKKYPIKVKIGHNEPIAKAIEKAKHLVQLDKEFNHDAIIVLKSKESFNGREVWDVLLSLGLKWGDGDLFFWTNDNDYGDQGHFIVWTTTDPGYFLPQSILNGQLNPTDLIFGFSIPRSADPENIYISMLNAITYCQKRLGGTILDKEGKPLNKEQETKYIKNLIAKMKAKGIEPGSHKALKSY